MLNFKAHAQQHSFYFFKHIRTSINQNGMYKMLFNSQFTEIKGQAFYRFDISAVQLNV